MAKKDISIAEMIKKAISKIEGEKAPATKKVKVGRVSLEMIERVREIDERHNRQHEELKEKLDAFGDETFKIAEAKVAAFAAELEREHKPDCIQARRDMAAAWEDIHNELGLPESERAVEYSLNAITGDISKEIPLEETEKEKVFH